MNVPREIKVASALLEAATNLKRAGREAEAELMIEQAVEIFAEVYHRLLEAESTRNASGAYARTIVPSSGRCQ